MSLENRIKSLDYVFKIIKKNIESIEDNELSELIKKAEIYNPWFTKNNTILALKYWTNTLNEDNLNNWLSYYSFFSYNIKNVALILTGNIPFIGLHDCISTLLLGHNAKIKLSEKDQFLIPYVLNLWKEFCPKISFEFVERLKNCDAVITTENNSKTNYLNKYFENIPNIIRKKRTSIAVITGEETDEELELLADDVFMYFGLDCRNIANIQIPKAYNLDKLFKSYLKYHDVINHNKYCNNYDYNKAICLLNGDLFWDNNFILLKDDERLYSPLAVLHYHEYENLEEVNQLIENNKKAIQCVVSNYFSYKKAIQFGNTQNPELKQYVDEVDTINFLLSL